MKTRNSNRWAVCTIVFTAIAFPTLLVLPAYEDCGYICDYDASRMGYRIWLGAIKANSWSTVSPVEKFMQQKCPDALKHHWTAYKGTGRNIYGQVLYLRHSQPGPAIQLPTEILEACYPKLSDVEKRHFYDQLCDPSADMPVLMKTLMPEMAAKRGTNSAFE